MNVTVFAGVLAKLNADSQMIVWGITFFRARRIAPADCPCGTLQGNNERSTPQPGYNASKIRDNTPTAQVDLWATAESESFPRSGEDLDLVADRVDEVLLGVTPVTGTRGWEKTTESSQFEDDTGIYHVARRYSFRYNVTDA